jgi:4-oxalomesaconate tautomerase
MAQTAIPCTVMRGGTSKGLYFRASDLPADVATRDAVLLAAMGSPDARQIDGMGGAHPLTSKIAVVGPPTHPDADVDYLFLQAVVDEARIDDGQNCGNLLAGVAPFAIERGLVTPDAAATAAVRINMVNTGGIAVATVRIADGMPVYAGSTAIAGVPGTGSEIRLDFVGTEGSTCGSLLPTGRAVDIVEGVEVTLIDNGMPVVVLRAADVGVTGYEQPDELEANQDLRDIIERIRLVAGPMMNLGDVGALTVPKLTLVAEPRDGGALCTRTFIPHRCHDAIGVLGAVSVATAALIPGTPAASVAELTPDAPVVVEHPTGTFDAAIDFHVEDGRPVIDRAGIIRTARKLMDGVVFPRPTTQGTDDVVGA